MLYTNDYTNECTYNEDARNDLVPWVNALHEMDGIELDSDHNFGGVNYHWHKPTQVTPPVASHHYSAADIDKTQWVTIGWEWKPGLVTYYVDGVAKHTFSYTDERYSAQEIWLSGLANDFMYFGGGGIPNPGAHMKVDWVRYYTAPFVSNLIGNANFETNGGASDVPLNWIQDDGVYNNLYTEMLVM